MEDGAIDLHTKPSQIRIVTANGTVIFERRIVTRADQFAAVFRGRDRMRIRVESSTESEWVATCLEGLGQEVIVADPNFAAMYGTRTRRINATMCSRTTACPRRPGSARPAPVFSDRPARTADRDPIGSK